MVALGQSSKAWVHSFELRTRARLAGASVETETVQFVSQKAPAHSFEREAKAPPTGPRVEHVVVQLAAVPTPA